MKLFAVFEQLLIKPEKPPVRSYKTEFKRDETPLSEGGLWLNGRKDGIDWADVLVKDGRAFGEVTRMMSAERRAEQSVLGAGAAAGAQQGDYDDPTAVLAGKWGRDQYAKARVFSRKQTDKYFQEVEIRLRSSMLPHHCDGYEVFWRCLKTGRRLCRDRPVEWQDRRFHIAGETGRAPVRRRRWRSHRGIHRRQCHSRLSERQGGDLRDRRQDPQGQPGIGFNFFVGNTNVDHGLTSFEVHTYD